jgi:hypothetical protein
VAKEEIEFLIRPDGTVEETTHGLLGGACEEVTAGIEAALGEITQREATADRYAPPEREEAGQRTDLDPPTV